jgi:putative membrane protein
MNQFSEQDKDSPKPGKDRTSWKETPYLFVKGFLMGSADIVPGVSGGTLALITGIYHRLIYAIKSVDMTTLKYTLKLRFDVVFENFHWKFLILLFAGIASAILFFTRIVPLQVYMFTHPEIVYGLFFGLILGSVFLLFMEVDDSYRNWKSLLPLLAGSAIGFWVVTLVPADTPETFLFVFLSGSIAICAMILPGISGSYILLIFRKYDYILSQIGQLGSDQTVGALMNLLPFVLGALVGIMLFSRLLSWLLDHYYSITLLILIGFLIGSLYVIWPYQEREYAEMVRETDVLPADDPLVDEIRSREVPPAGPEYFRLQDDSESINNEMQDTVVVERVSRKLVYSKPFIPWTADDDHEEHNLSDGLAGMAAGFLLIGGIAFLRKRSEPDKPVA